MEYIQIQFSEKMRMLMKNFIIPRTVFYPLFTCNGEMILFFFVVVLNENILFYIFKYIRVE